MQRHWCLISIISGTVIIMEWKCSLIKMKLISWMEKKRFLSSGTENDPCSLFVPAAPWIKCSWLWPVGTLSCAKVCQRVYLPVWLFSTWLEKFYIFMIYFYSHLESCPLLLQHKIKISAIKSFIFHCLPFQHSKIRLQLELITERLWFRHTCGHLQQETVNKINCGNRF